jgi:3-oxoacid CoA-transferase subunit A
VDKLVASAAEAVGDVPSGASLAVGGLGLCGIPSVLIGALSGTGAEDLEVVPNNCGADGLGLGLLGRAARRPRAWSRPQPRP